MNMKKRSKKKFKNLKNSIFIKSFNDSKNKFLNIMMYDLLMLVFFIAGFFLFNRFLTKKADALQVFNVQELMNKTAEEIAENAMVIQNFLIVFIISFVFFIVYLVFMFSFFQGKNYALIVDKRFSKNYLKRFFFLNLVIVFGWIISLIVLVSIFKENAVPYIVLVLLALMMYILPVVYPLFAKKPCMESIKKAFAIGFKKARVIIAYVLSFLVFLVISLLSLTLRALPDRIEFSIIFVILLIYLAWFRVYISKVVV